MRLLLSKVKRDNLVGSFEIYKRGKTSGHTQVYSVILVNKALKVEVSNAGTIIVDPLKWDFDGMGEGAIISLEDFESNRPEIEDEVEVEGLVELVTSTGVESVSPFKGTFYTTGYLRRAWTSLLDPNWDGNWNF